MVYLQDLVWDCSLIPRQALLVTQTTAVLIVHIERNLALVLYEKLLAHLTAGNNLVAFVLTITMRNRNSTLKQSRTASDASIDKFIAKMLSWDPEDRPSAIEALSTLTSTKCVYRKARPWWEM